MLEGDGVHDHLEKNYAGGEEVLITADVSLVLEHLGQAVPEIRTVPRTADQTLLVQFAVATRESKVGEGKAEVPADQNVFRLDVQVGDSLLLQVLEPWLRLKPLRSWLK